MIDMVQLDLLAGRRLKSKGISSVAGHNAAFVEAVRAQARAICTRHGSVTIDDLRAWASSIELVPKHQAVWGSIFHGYGWKKVGHQQTTVKTSHAREICVWQWEAP